MHLLREPRAPRADVRYLFGSYLADERNDAWRSYLFLATEATGDAELGPPATAGPMRDGDSLTIELPPAVARRAGARSPKPATRRRWSAARARPGAAGRRRRLGRGHRRRPEAVAALFPAASWENRFGTVTVPRQPRVEVRSPRSASRAPYLRPAPPGRGACGRIPGRGPGAPRLHDQRHGLAADATCRRRRPAGRSVRRRRRPGTRRPARALAIPRRASPRTRCASSARRASPPAWGSGSTQPTAAAHPPPCARRRQRLSGERVRDELLRMLGPRTRRRPPTALRADGGAGPAPWLLPEAGGAARHPAGQAAARRRA